MKCMLRINSFFFTIVLFFIFETEVRAQETTFYGMKWFTDKSVAIDSARSQGKQIFLLWGRTGCKYSQYVLRLMSDPVLKEVIEENYVLWFCNCEENIRFSPDVADYLSMIKGAIALPAICIIDTYDTRIAHGLTLGKQELDYLQYMLNNYVDNDIIINKAEVYVVENNLFIHDNFERELISVYSTTGLLIDQFNKTDYYVNHKFSVYPKGIIFVRSSLGWVQKVFVR